MLITDQTYRRSDFYQDYTGWCTDNGRKPFSKGRVKELLEHNIGLGIRLVELNGYETFRGIAKKTAQGSPPKAPMVRIPLPETPAIHGDSIAIPDSAAF